MLSIPHLALIVALLAGATAQGHSHSAIGDPPAIHGMLVVGTNTVYLSHLPMFHSPHNYQVLFEAKFDDASLAIYKSQLAQAPNGIFTLVPQPFVLPDMVASPHPFQAELYKGHFERGGVKIATSVRVEITKILYFQKFQPGASKAQNAQFILFGNPSEQFLAHVITAAPDFDQIVQIRPIPSSPPVITFSVPGHSPDKALVPGETFVGHASNSGDLSVEVSKRLYLETEDLLGEG